MMRRKCASTTPAPCIASEKAAGEGYWAFVPRPLEPHLMAMS